MCSVIREGRYCLRPNFNATLQVSPRGIQVIDSGYGWYLLGIQRYWVRSAYSLPHSLFLVFLDDAVALRAVILLDLSAGLPFLRGYSSLRRFHVAFVDGTWGRTYFVSFLGVPLSLRAAVSRSFTRFSGFSAFLRIPGIVRESPPVPS